MPKSISMCINCRDSYYSLCTKAGCWKYKSARIVTRVRVGTWEQPPYPRERAQKCLSCFSEEGYGMLELDDCRVKPRSQIAKEK